jgi:hypothetical protein
MAPLPPWITPYLDQTGSTGGMGGGTSLTSQYAYTPSPAPAGAEFGSTFTRSPAATPSVTPAWNAGPGPMAGSGGGASGNWFTGIFGGGAEQPKIYAGKKPSEMNAEQLAAFYKDNQPSKIPGYINTGLGVLGAGWDIYSGYKAMQQADKMFGLQSSIANTNLASQLSAYNSAMDDKIRGRYSAQERSSEEGQKRIKEEQDRHHVTKQS